MANNLTPLTLNFEPPTLSMRARNNWVMILQNRLAALGYYNGTINGSFGRETKDAVIRFQLEYGLNNTGEVDGATWAILLSEGNALYNADKIPKATIPTLQGANKNISHQPTNILRGAEDTEDNEAGTKTEVTENKYEDFIDQIEQEINQTASESRYSDIQDNAPAKSPFSMSANESTKSPLEINNATATTLSSPNAQKQEQSASIPKPSQAETSQPVQPSIQPAIQQTTNQNTTIHALGQPIQPEQKQIDYKKLILLAIIFFLLMINQRSTTEIEPEEEE